jgi:MYXO-CTERM domain-containing protein
VRRFLLAALALWVAQPRPVLAAPLRERPYRDHRYVVAQPRDAGDVEAIWNQAEYVIEPHDPALVPHTLVVSPASLQALRARAIPLRVDPRDVQAWVEGLDRPDAGRRPAGITLPLGGGRLGIFGPYFAQVQPLAAAEAYLDELAAASNGRARVVELGRSVEGRAVRALRISGAPDPTARPSVVVVGTQHAREWASPVVAMGLADALVRQYGVDPRVTRVVNELDIIINPVNNPDGYLATFNGRRLQRKNLNPTCNVDLNRNYDTAWGAGTAGVPCTAANFPGKNAFSEPESQAIATLIQSLARPLLFFDYHSNGAQVMIPFAYTTDPPPDYDHNRGLCELYSFTLRGLYGTSYPARPGFNLGRGQGGGAFDWFRTRFGATMVVELGGNGFAITDDQVLPFAEENWQAWLAVVERALDDLSAPTTDAGAPPAPAHDAAADRSPDAAASAGGGPGGTPAGTPRPPTGGGLAPDPTGPFPATPGEDPIGCACSVDGRSGAQGPLVFAAVLVLGALFRRRRSRRRRR